MILQLRDVFEVTGSSKNFSYSIPVEKMSGYKGYTFISPIAINGTLVNRAGIVTLTWHVDSRMKHTCDRCLCEFDRDYSYCFSETLVNSINHSDDEYIVCENYIFDLDELVISDLLLQFQSKTLCHDDCKGLCIKCGKNLNDGDCDCIKE